MKTTVAALCMVVGICLALILAIWAIQYPFKLGACHYYGYQTDREVKYAGFVGCMVKTPAGWVPRTEIRTAN